MTQLPTVKQVASELLKLLQERAPAGFTAAEAYRELGDRFSLSEADRKRPMGEHDPRSHWNNRVQYASRVLVDDGKLDRSQRNLWRLRQ